MGEKSRKVGVRWVKRVEDGMGEFVVSCGVRVLGWELKGVV